MKKQSGFCDFSVLEEIKVVGSKPGIPDNTPAYCECGRKGILRDCGSEMESEGWEYPDYIVATCPKCGDVVEY